MNELITTFHIDWKLIGAQLLNFAIVAFVLWRFALKPLMRTMTERAGTIEKSLADAQRIEKQLADTNRDIEERLRETRLQATAIMETAKKDADKKRLELLSHTKAEVEKVIAGARDQITREKEEALKQARNELAALVVQGVTGVLGHDYKDSMDHKLIAERVKKLR